MRNDTSIPQPLDHCTGCDSYNVPTTEQAVMTANGLKMTIAYCPDCMDLVYSYTADVQPIGVPDVLAMVDVGGYFLVLEELGQAWHIGTLEGPELTDATPGEGYGAWYATWNELVNGAH